MAEQTHDERRVLHELVRYPEHEPRETDSHYKIFTEARHHLIYVLKVGCWIGGATHDSIVAGLAQDHLCHGAKQLEAHHAIAEYAGLGEEDWQKVAADFPQLGIHSQEDWLCAAESEGGLMILCDKHHRGLNHGIHAITYPAWRLDRYVKQGYEFLPDVKEQA
jgi:hypothetical protein